MAFCNNRLSFLAYPYKLDVMNYSRRIIGLLRVNCIFIRHFRHWTVILWLQWTEPNRPTQDGTFYDPIRSNPTRPVNGSDTCPTVTQAQDKNIQVRRRKNYRPVYSDTTQLNWTRLNSTRQREQQLTQFVGRDVMNKNTTDLAVRCSTGSVELSWVVSL